MEQPLPHTDAAWERRGLLGRLPTHPALSLDPPLYKGGTMPQALTERETMRRTGGDWEEGDYHQCPPPFLLYWAEGARAAGEVGMESLSWGRHLPAWGPWL